MHSDVEATAGAAWRPDTIGDPVLHALVDVSADGLAVLDRHGRFTVLNAAAAHILGLPADDLLGRAAPFEPATRARTGPVRTVAVRHGRPRVDVDEPSSTASPRRPEGGTWSGSATSPTRCGSRSG